MTEELNGHTEKSKFLALGGDPVLDLCNTIVFHGDFTEDRLAQRRDADLFFQQFFSVTTLLSQKQFELLLNIRTGLRSQFAELISKKAKHSSPKRELSEVLSAIVFVLGWDPRSQAFNHLQIIKQEQKFLEPLLNSYRAFASQLTPLRLKICANKNCSHLFLDSTRSNTRAWCSMKSCGNLIKARKFQARQKKKNRAYPSKTGSAIRS